MSMPLSGNELMVLLHFYIQSKPRPIRAYLSKDAYDKAITVLTYRGLIREWESEPGDFSLTPRGNKFVEMLKEVPFPVERWVDPRTLKEKQNATKI